MKVAIVGSREIQNFDLKKLLSYIPQNCSEIISGGAKGIDTLAKQAAKHLGIPCIEYLPEYDKYGTVAPLKRNQKIVQEAHLVLAFWDMHSNGTKNTIDACIEKRVPFRIIQIDDKTSSHK